MAPARFASDVVDRDHEEDGLCAMCFVRWFRLNSVKTWCRLGCFVATIVHGAVYALIACLLILDLR